MKNGSVCAVGNDIEDHSNLQVFQKNGWEIKDGDGDQGMAVAGGMPQDKVVLVVSRRLSRPLERPF